MSRPSVPVVATTPIQTCAADSGAHRSCCQMNRSIVPAAARKPIRTCVADCEKHRFLPSSYPWVLLNCSSGLMPILTREGHELAQNEPLLSFTDPCPLLRFRILAWSSSLGGSASPLLIGPRHISYSFGQRLHVSQKRQPASVGAKRIEHGVHCSGGKYRESSVSSPF